MKETDQKMRNRKSLFGIYLPFFILLLLGAIALRTVSTMAFFNMRYHYFTNRPLPLIASVLLVSAILSFIIYIIATKKQISLIPSFSSPANYIPSAIVSAALVFMIANLMGKLSNSLPFPIGIKPDERLALMLVIFLLLALSVLAALSIVYFVLNTIFIRTVSARRATYGLFVILFLSLYMAYLYFDTAAPINSPIKTVDQMAYVFAAVFFLYEIRLSLGREQWKLYLIFGYIAAAICAYSSIPALITYFAKNKTVISNSIYESILTFTLFLFISLKLLLTDKLVENSEDPFIEKLKEMAQKRTDELTPHVDEAEEVSEDTVEEAPDENQISILDMQAEYGSEPKYIEASEESENINTEEDL